ncbi:hypothetical protein E4U21_007161 [Claviceps maximensis]|nr:hypothetical protein E4U21_007161 [Claviceps maximensis]
MTPSSRPPQSAAVDSMSLSATATASTSTSASVSATSASAHMARFEFSDLGTKILMVEWHPNLLPPSPSSCPSSSLPSTNTTVSTTIADIAAAAAASSTTSSSDTTISDTTASDTVTAVSSKDVHRITPQSDTIVTTDTTTTTPILPNPAVHGPQAAAAAAAWEVSWPGKSTFLPASETDHDEAGPRRRVYFLLPPEAPIPTHVTITPPGSDQILVKPLPAIFPPGFDAEAGTRGVLHTLWAKKRLSELHREMEAELRANAESVGLEMAMAEKEWIVANFLSTPSPPPPCPDAAASAAPAAPTPGRLRLGDKLKGLRLATSAADLVPNPKANTFTGTDVPSQTLSPQGTDIAVSSFSSSMARGTVRAAEPMSLDAAVRGESALIQGDSCDGEDELFALPLSPRSPDMKRGPFSALG